MRTLEFIFNWPGLIEAVAFEADDDVEELVTEGYRDSGIPDLMIDLDPRTGQPYGFMSHNFDKTYPVVIWGLKLRMANELYNVPQAGLSAVPLHEAFSWAYYHFILEDGALLESDLAPVGYDGMTRTVLAHSLAAV